MKLSGQKWSQSLTAVYEGWSFMIGSCYGALSGKIQVLWIGGYGRCLHEEIWLLSFNHLKLGI